LDRSISELEDFFSACAQHLRRITRADAWSGILGRRAPGAKATAIFTDRSKKGDGEIIDIINVLLSNPDFAPFLQRARSDDENTFSHHRA
jgi:hypothetical protein